MIQFRGYSLVAQQAHFFTMSYVFYGFRNFYVAFMFWLMLTYCILAFYCYLLFRMYFSPKELRPRKINVNTVCATSAFLR